MSAETIASALGGARKTAKGWWNAKCPAHDDTRASLGLKDTDDGNVAYNCKAGCSTAAVADALRGRRLLPEHEVREKPAKPRRRIVATYDYKDATGALLFQVVRYYPKDFRQRRPDGNGGWNWSVGDLDRPLYCLPELLAADAAEPVFLVEGEKDADRLRSCGLVATTTAQGAKGWVKSNHAPLAGRHVVLLPDNDAAGRSYAVQAALDLAGKAASLRWVTLPDVPEKGDVSVWLDRGGTVDLLRDMVALAQHYEPPHAGPVAPEAVAEDDDGWSPSTDGWTGELHRNDRGEARDIIHNATVILRTDSRFKSRIRFNLFLGAVEAMELPWRKGPWSTWTDADDLQLAAWCQERQVYLRPKTCADAVQVVSRDHEHHPVRERLDGLVWDGAPRLDTWLSVYMGVPDTPYSRAVGKAWLVSGVARIMRPGCKADHTLIFEGIQGAGKSSAAAALAMEDAWFTDEIADLGTKDAAQDLRGKWLIEMGELSAIQRGALERVKAFLTRKVDHYRPSYGKRSEDHPGHCIFVGSTNSDSYLQDETGNRRFWPVRCGEIMIENLRRDAPQLWAEAVLAFHAGTKWWLDRDMEQAAREHQEERLITDPWEWRICDHVVGKVEVSVAEILDACIKIPAERQTQRDENRVARILRAMKWERKQARRNGSRTWLYRPTEAMAPAESGDVTTSTNECGDDKSSVSGHVTDVSNVTSMSSIHVGAPSRVRARAGAVLFPDPPVTGDSGDTPVATDADGWVDL
jgi:predicted P-loop ATPase